MIDRIAYQTYAQTRVRPRYTPCGVRLFGSGQDHALAVFDVFLLLKSTSHLSYMLSSTTIRKPIVIEECSLSGILQSHLAAYLIPSNDPTVSIANASTATYPIYQPPRSSPVKPASAM